MALAILQQGKTAIRDSVATLISHIAVTDDGTAFSISQTVANPAGGATTVLTKAATQTAVDANTMDETITITGATEFTGKVINCICAAKGTGTTGAGTDTLSRSPRTAGLGIGVQSGDVYTVGVRSTTTDAS
jgi:hypothetical protein